MKTATQAATKLIGQLNARIPRGIRGVHSVWVRTDISGPPDEPSEFMQWICVAINPATMPRVLASLPEIPAEIDGWPVQRVAWPSGPDVATVASYEDGTVPA